MCWLLVWTLTWYYISIYSNRVRNRNDSPLSFSSKLYSTFIPIQTIFYNYIHFEPNDSLHVTLIAKNLLRVTSKVLILLSTCTPIKAIKGGGKQSNRENLVHTERGRDPILTIFLFVDRFGINCIKWKTRLSRNRKISDSQCIHFFLALAFGTALKKKLYTHM